MEINGWQLRALACPVEDLVQFPKPAWQLTADREPTTKGWSHLFWPLRTPDKQMVHRQTYRRHAHAHAHSSLKERKMKNNRSRRHLTMTSDHHTCAHVRTHMCTYTVRKARCGSLDGDCGAL